MREDGKIGIEDNKKADGRFLSFSVDKTLWVWYSISDKYNILYIKKRENPDQFIMKMKGKSATAAGQALQAEFS